MGVPLTTKEAKGLVIERLGARLGPEFAFKKADECFLRRTVAGADLLFVGFWAYPPKFVFSVTPADRRDRNALSAGVRRPSPKGGVSQ